MEKFESRCTAVVSVGRSKVDRRSVTRDGPGKGGTALDIKGNRKEGQQESENRRQSGRRVGDRALLGADSGAGI